MSLAEIEKAIRMPVSYSVPNSYIELVRSANLGVPLSAASENGFTKELMNWAEALVGTTGPTETRASKFGNRIRLRTIVKNFQEGFPILKRHTNA